MADSIFEESEELELKVPDTYPTLDVYIPIRRVKLETLEKTVKAMVAQDYPKDKLSIYVADDTPEKDRSDQYAELCEKYEVNYIYDPSNKLYKSGMLNIAIPQGNGRFIAFFDYDQIPLEGILRHMVEVLLAHPDRVFVQTKKKFRDLYNLSRVWSALLYVQFFEVMEKTRNKLKTVLFAGSTACFRRLAIEELGGIPEVTFTEDNELTTALLLEGKYGIFSDVYGSLGTVPYGFPAQVAQLWRWSHGGSHVLHKEFVNIVKSRELNWNQKFEIMSLLSVTPILVFTYLYVVTFIPLLIAGVDSPRFILFGVSTLFYIPLGPAFTYLLMVIVALWRVQKVNPEFDIKQLPGFLIIALASNMLIMGSGILGIFGIWGPKSKHGKWTRYLPLKKIAIFTLILGIGSIYLSIMWLMQGLHSAIILLAIGISILPTFPVVFYYTREDKH